MRRDLLRAGSLKDSLEVSVVRENERILFAVVRVNVTLSHVSDVLLIISLSILNLILGLLPIIIINPLPIIHLIAPTLSWFVELHFVASFGKLPRTWI